TQDGRLDAASSEERLDPAAEELRPDRESHDDHRHRNEKTEERRSAAQPPEGQQEGARSGRHRTEGLVNLPCENLLPRRVHALALAYAIDEREGTARRVAKDVRVRPDHHHCAERCRRAEEAQDHPGGRRLCERCDREQHRCDEDHAPRTRPVELGDRAPLAADRQRKAERDADERDPVEPAVEPRPEPPHRHTPGSQEPSARRAASESPYSSAGTPASSSVRAKTSSVRSGRDGSGAVDHTGTTVCSRWRPPCDAWCSGHSLFARRSKPVAAETSRSPARSEAKSDVRAKAASGFRSSCDRARASEGVASAKLASKAPCWKRPVSSKPTWPTPWDAWSSAVFGFSPRIATLSTPSIAR